MQNRDGSDFPFTLPLLLSEIEHIISSLKKISANHRKWSNEYSYNTHTNEYVFKGDTKNSIHERVNKWFELENL